jgi:hypothetical protein
MSERRLPTVRWLIWIVPAAIGVGIFASVVWFWEPSFAKFYEDKLRASLFTGYFTLSGFLFTAKTFIILNMKKEMFSTTAYLKRFAIQQRLKPDMQIYKPLRDIGRVLLINVVLCLASSISQFTLGLYPNVLTVAICLALAASAVGMLIFSLSIIAWNLHDMYAHFEDEAQGEVRKLQPNSTSASHPTT